MKALVRSSLWLFLLLPWSIDGAASSRAEGKSNFIFDGWPGPPLRIFVSQPAGPVTDLPVVIVMHGMSRNADDYRDQWHELAQQHKFVLLVPEFTRDDFPGSRGYNLGNTRDKSGQPVPTGQWSFSAIEQLFDFARQRFSLSADRYALYGHSAGSQFVHRFLMHVPEARVSRAVLANAGWYTLPDANIDWPYGLKHSVAPGAGLRRLLELPVTVLLGQEDTDPNDDSLRRTPEAMEQGPHRLARGENYLRAAQHAARDLDISLDWTLIRVEGADHDNAKMAPFAAPHLLDD